jgi:transposase
VAELCVNHLAYIWLCGGVSMNYHTLSDFRTQHGAALDQLLTQVVHRLRDAGGLNLTPMRKMECGSAPAPERLRFIAKRL